MLDVIWWALTGAILFNLHLVIALAVIRTKAFTEIKNLKEKLDSAESRIHKIDLRVDGAVDTIVRAVRVKSQA